MQHKNKFIFLIEIFESWKLVCIVLNNHAQETVILCNISLVYDFEALCRISLMYIIFGYFWSLYTSQKPVLKLPLTPLLSVC